MFRPTLVVMARIICAFTILVAPTVARAADEFSDCKVIRSLPKATAEMERLHRDNSRNKCEPLTEGQSLETTNYAIIMRLASRSTKLRSRHSIWDHLLGLIMDSADRADLPMVSRSKILEYMEQH